MLTMPEQPTSRRARHKGTRTCAGCGARVDQERVRSELIRLVLVSDGDEVRAHVDLGGSGVGRGSWVHARPKCFQDACARGLSRSAKAKVLAEPERLGRELREQAARRLRSLIGTAQRTGNASVGSAAVRDSLRRKGVALLIIAADAAAAAKHREVELAAVEGRAVTYGTKASLGETLGRGEVGVVGIEDDGMAAAIRHTIGLSEMFARY